MSRVGSDPLIWADAMADAIETYLVTPALSKEEAIANGKMEEAVECYRQARSVQND